MWSLAVQRQQHYDLELSSSHPDRVSKASGEHFSHFPREESSAEFMGNNNMSPCFDSGVVSPKRKGPGTAFHLFIYLFLQPLTALFTSLIPDYKDKKKLINNER